jgi:hypothetical protein
MTAIPSAAPDPLAARPAGSKTRNVFPKLGTCYSASIEAVTDRFGGKPSKDTGTRVYYANGPSQVDYDLVPQVARSRVGDKVRICVVELPQHCPPGDMRGIVYRTHNLRTDEEWVMSDSQHGCGGA